MFFQWKLHLINRESNARGKEYLRNNIIPFHTIAFLLSDMYILKGVDTTQNVSFTNKKPVKKWPRLIYIIIYIHRTQLTKPHIKVSHVNKKRQTQRLCPDSFPDFPSAIAWFQVIFLLDSKLALRSCPSEKPRPWLDIHMETTSTETGGFPEVPTPEKKKKNADSWGVFVGVGAAWMVDPNWMVIHICSVFFWCVNEKKHIKHISFWWVRAGGLLMRFLFIQSYKSKAIWGNQNRYLELGWLSVVDVWVHVPWRFNRQKLINHKVKQ